MTRDRIGLLMALLGIGLCGACGSSPALTTEADADVNGAGPSSTGGATSTVGTSGGGVDPGSAGTGGSSGGGESTSSDPDRTIASGTVAMNPMMGPATASCQQLLRLNNPAQSLIGYVQMNPAQFQNDRRAGEPSYVYLDGGKDAVMVPGPPVSYASSSVDILAAQLTTCVEEESACQGQDGYRVKVNERLTYVITIDDWEEEIALGTIELCLNNGNLTTTFVFAGLGVYLGGGVAHNVTITPILDSVPGTPTSPVTIECRAKS